MSSAVSIEQLKDLLGDKLCTPEQVRAPEGVATGFQDLDRYLFGHGLPKGALTLLSGAIGTGATSLWIEAASRLVAQGKWVAWVNNDIPLSPLPLHQKGVNLGHFVSIQPDVESYVSADGSYDSAEPIDETKRANKSLFFILQELLSSSLFELIGCDLGRQRIKEHQLRKLQAQARDANVALVFLSQDSNVLRQTHLSSTPIKRAVYRGSAAQAFSLILEFGKKQITVERALHRQVPHRFPRSVSYARFTTFSANFDSLGNTQVGHSRSGKDPLLETSRAVHSVGRSRKTV